MKKIFSAILIVILTFSCIIQSSAYEADKFVQNLTWSYDAETKTLEFSGSGPMNNYATNRLVPWKKYRTVAEKIVLPEGLTTIGDFAFYGFENLTDINIPSTVKTIGNGSISVCSSLVYLVLPQGVEAIGGWCFAGDTSLEYLSLPNTLKSINYECFLHCPKLMELYVPSSVTEISDFSLGYGIGHSNYYDMIVYGSTGSAIQSYAKANMFHFIPGNAKSVKSPYADLFCNTPEEDLKLTDINGDNIISAKDLLALRTAEQ